MLSIEEISARLEITQKITDYATAIDSCRWDDLEAVFTPDAVIDYSAVGGIVGPFPEVKAWLAQVLPGFSTYCHLVGNHDITVDGDTATSRSLCLNPMQAPDGTTFLIGIWYRDTWILGEDGWRIRTRTEEKCFDTTL